MLKSSESNISNIHDEEVGHGHPTASTGTYYQFRRSSDNGEPEKPTLLVFRYCSILFIVQLLGTRTSIIEFFLRTFQLTQG